MAQNLQDLNLTPGGNKIVIRVTQNPFEIYHFSVAKLDVTPSTIVEDKIAEGWWNIALVKELIKKFVHDNFIVIVFMNGLYGDWSIHFPDLLSD